MKNVLPPFQSYFWLYAPAGDVMPKKRKTGDLSAVFAAQANGNNQVSARLCDLKHLHATHQRRLTIFEQPRSRTEVGQYRYQPVQDVETVLRMVNAAQDVANDYMPIALGGAALQIIEKTNKLHMALTFNPEAEDCFEEFHAERMDEMDEAGGVQDLYKEPRKPRLLLSKAYKADFRRNVDIKSACASFNNAFEKFQTKPILFNRLVLGQGFFDIHGKNLGQRDVATVHFDGRQFEWHCDDPFDANANIRLIAQTADSRAQAQADAPRRPLPVS